MATTNSPGLRSEERPSKSTGSFVCGEETGQGETQMKFIRDSSTLLFLMDAAKKQKEEQRERTEA